LIAAWPERPGRTCFAVGDPMQSIYFFRDADAELFARVKNVGLEIFHDEPLPFDFVSLKANFRTAPSLALRLNELLGQVFAADDGSGVSFSSVEPARTDSANSTAPGPDPRFSLHLEFVPRTGPSQSADSEAVLEAEAARAAQIEEIVALIRNLLNSPQSSVPQVPILGPGIPTTGADRKPGAPGPDFGTWESAQFDPPRARNDKFRIAVLGRTRSALAPIAQALREANIPFRAVELEKLSARPEVLDALALARALLNREDRVAWLGILRAPWCGLSLEDLHRIAGADDPELVTRAVPELLDERLDLLGKEGRIAAARVLEALNFASRLRAAQPSASLGTWLERVWLRLGGAACVDAAARANLDLLWSFLDRLPGGETDLLGPALDAALDKLTALPDPEASGDHGVQLMTIHKSKGLEFEAVIVPELQAGGGRGGRRMLSWLERGLAEPDDSGEITEFLVAPFQAKGAERGSAKAWVDQVYRRRESQEMRRILYVAATRARDQLHLFARPAYKVEADGALSLAEPSASLLATAWPALEEEIRARFEQWKAVHANAAPAQEQVVECIAAAGESNLLESNLRAMPCPVKPTLLRRLPPANG
jgi:ATP-dependent exoDNAse (exonuclease V) beta subunit